MTNLKHLYSVGLAAATVLAASIVKERYAKGEITREQLEQMMRDLRQQEGG